MQLLRRKWLVAGVTLFLLFSVSIALGQDGRDNVAPPRVIDTNPVAGEELQLDRAVTFTFDRPMDVGAAGNAFTVNPTLEGASWGWNESNTALTLTPPSAGYARNTEYLFSVFSIDSDGQAMAEPFELRLQTVGFLEITDALPVDGSEDIEADTTITVIFNRPVVPLVNTPDMADLPQPLTITPETAGVGEWLNTSIYIFRPTEPLVGGSQYTVTVNQGLASLDGAILSEAYMFSFTTVDPRIERVYPGDGETQIELQPEIQIWFSQPMDPATQTGIFLEGGGTRPEVEYAWSEDRRYVTLTPLALLELDTLYDIIVDETVVRSGSGAALERGYLQSFLTVPYPAILRTRPANGDQNAEPYGGISIYFTAPIDPDTLEGKFTIEPEPWREFETYYYDYDNRYSLFFDTEPSTTYTVTIAPGIADPYGNTITEETVVRYTTGPYVADLTLNVPGTVGLYNAFNPTTRLFINHRNVTQLELELYRIDKNVVAGFTGPNSWDFEQSFTPNPANLVRAWQMAVVNPLNIKRYELVMLSEESADGAGNITCLGAPPTQLAIGVQARVSEDDPTPLNLRTAPNLGGRVLTQYEPGAVFEVRNGPVCADNFLWWQVYNAETNIEGWVAEGSFNVYFIEPTEPVTPAETDSRQDQLPALPPGAYYLRVDSPETRAIEQNARRHLLLVSTVNLTMKFSPDSALAWVTNMQSGQPVANVPVTFYNERFNEIGMAMTDEDGLAVVNIPRLEALWTTVYSVVETPEHFGLVTTNFSSGISPWEFGLSVNYEPNDRSIYLNTDRPIYRPDQPVYFRGILRNRDDVTYTPVTGRSTVPVEVYDPNGQIIYETEVPLTPFGTFSGEFELSSGAPLGYYRLNVNLSEDWQDQFSIGFNVAEYRAPEFQVTLTPAVDEVVQGDTIQVEVDSRYFFGAPVSNAQVEWNAIGNNYPFFYTGDKPGNWRFVDYSVDEGASEFYEGGQELVGNGTGTTDDQGRFIIEIPADLGEKTLSQIYTIEAVVTDESDQAVAGRTTVIVHQGEVYIGLSPEEYVGFAGQETSFNVLTVGWESEPIAGQVVDYRIVERRWSSVQERDPQGRTIWKYEVEEIEIASGSVTTDSEGLARVVFTPPTGGVFKIYGVTRDVRGNTVNSSGYMWVSGREYVAWRQQNSNRIDLIANAQNFDVDETAEILIASPFQGQTKALVTVERGDILMTEVITMDTNSYVYRLPILPEYAPNVYVSVIIVKGVDETNPYTQFRVGMIELGVETDRLVMNVEVTPDLEEGETAGPGDEVTLNVKTTDWQGNPVSAEVGLGVTDLAVLSIASPNSGTLLNYFYGQQSVSINTSSTLTISVDQITQTIIDTIKGGGGGGQEGGIFDIRQDFVDTPLWEPALVTDENGQGQITVTLPDNLTTWRVDARAITSGVGSPMLVGQTTTDFISTKLLLIRPITPRFMVVGDRLNLGAIVNNNTNQPQTVEVSMQGTGFTVLNNLPLTQTVEIPAGGRQRVDWQVEVQDVKSVDVFFAAQNGDGSLSDASKPPLGQGDDRLLPVYKYVVAETVGTAGTLEGPDAGNRTEFIVLPERLDVEQGELTINLNRSLASPVLDGLDYLRNYEHQCIEQTVSRFLPNVMTMRALTALNQSNAELEENLRREVNFGLQRLYAQQKVDGGWGWFPADESNPLTTAYALIALIEAQSSGFSVEQRVIDRAKGFLRQYLLETEESVRVNLAANWQMNRRAFVLYALARGGEPNASRISGVYDQRERLNLDAKAFLAMAMMISNPDDERLDVLFSDFVNVAKLSATGTSWPEASRDYYNWTTNTRTTALVLMALIKHDVSNDLLPGAVRWLIVARNADAWETTQETAWVVMSLTDWMVATQELEADYTFNVSLNGNALALEDNTATTENVKDKETLRIAVAELLRDEANRLSFIKSEGTGNLYYTAHLRSFLDVPSIEPVSRGIIVSRQYTLIGDPERRPITSARVNEEVQVTLTIVAPNDLHYVVVEDPIPAGSDAVNPQLLTTSILGQRPTLSRSDPLSRGWGWWWFSRTEFRDEKVVMYATYLPRGTYTYTYTLRMGLAGEYNVIPTIAQEFYFPEVYGRGAGLLFRIEPAEVFE